MIDVAGRSGCLLLALAGVGCGTVEVQSRPEPDVRVKIVDLRRAVWDSAPPEIALGPEWAVATIQVRNRTPAVVPVGSWSLPTLGSVEVYEDASSARLIAPVLERVEPGVDILVCPPIRTSRRAQREHSLPSSSAGSRWSWFPRGCSRASSSPRSHRWTTAGRR